MLICIVFIIFYWVFIKNPMYPPEPVKEGKFPLRPIQILELDENITASPTVQDTVILVRTMESLYAINGDSGEPIWHVETPSNNKNFEHAPIIVNDMVIVSKGESGVEAFSIMNGKSLWNDQIYQQQIVNSDQMFIDEISASDDVLYVARRSWKLTAYDLETGIILWDMKLPSRAVVYLDSDSEKVYMSIQNSVKAFNGGNGQLIWERVFDSPTGPIHIDEGILYISLYKDYAIVAIDLENFEQIWHISSDQNELANVRRLSTDEYTLYASAQKLIAITKKDGNIQWISDELGHLETPVFLDDLIFVRNTKTKLYAIEATTGNTIGTLLVQFNTTGLHNPDRSPVVFTDKLILPFGNNKVYIYKR